MCDSVDELDKMRSPLRDVASGAPGGQHKAMMSGTITMCMRELCQRAPKRAAVASASLSDIFRRRMSCSSSGVTAAVVSQFVQSVPVEEPEPKAPLIFRVSFCIACLGRGWHCGEGADRTLQHIEENFQDKLA